MSKFKVRLVSAILSIAMIGLMFVVGAGVIKKINSDTNVVKSSTCKCEKCHCCTHK